MSTGIGSRPAVRRRALLARRDVAAVRAATAAGSVTVNVAPRPAPSLSTPMAPPCASTSWREMNRPSPRPPTLRVGALSA